MEPVLKSLGCLFLCLLTAQNGVVAQSAPIDTDIRRPGFRLELGVQDDGTATARWAEGVAVAIGAERAELARRQHLPISDEAGAWVNTLEGSVAAAERRSGELAVLLDIEPFNATIVAGNRASSDAFAWLPDHIGINVQAFAETYGPPDDGATDRMVRIVAHEYVHLLTYAHYPDHLQRRQSPLDRALWTMFFEGLGDYVSVSSRWLPDDSGKQSETTVETLERLEPILVARLERLASASESEEPALRRGISMGKFDEKWGSLPVALWLHSEVTQCGETRTLRALLQLERNGVLPLAHRHAAKALLPRIEALAAKNGTRFPSRTGCIWYLAPD